MTVAFPWSGRDVNALVPLSGRAAVPNTPAGAGFNWPSLVGRVSGYIRPVRGGGWGLSGLGQALDIYGAPTTVMGGGTDSVNLVGTGGYVDVSGTSVPGWTGGSVALPTITGGSSGSANAAAASGAPWWAGILASSLSTGLKVGSQIASYQLNPLYQKSTFYQTPQGAIYASNAPAGSIVPGLTTGTGSSLLPILLIGGVLVMFMAMRK